MSKICSKCNKTVYPLEELKCLDKIWHKTCFKCWECGMTLNMKNYKGYDKKPYCSAHYPQMKATTVAETPELQRIAQNTKIQSQIKYHEDFEKNIKGSKIQVSDDPELQRVKQVNSLVSQVEYKNKDKSEDRRTSLTSSGGEKWMPGPVSPSANKTSPIVRPSPYSERATSHSTSYTAEGKVEGVARVTRIGSIADYDPVNENYGSLTTGYKPTSTSRQSQSQEWEEVVPISHQTKSARSSASSDNSDNITGQKDPQVNQAMSTSGIGSSSEADQHNSSNTQQQDDVFPAKHEEPAHELTAHTHIDPPAEEERRAEVNEVNDPDINEVSDPVPQLQQLHVQEADEEEEQIDSQPHVAAVEKSHAAEEEDEEPGSSLGAAVFLTQYDYDAQDEDEVSFQENDKMINVRSVDDGWMFGTVERTGQRGMFPANYVEEIK